MNGKGAPDSNFNACLQHWAGLPDGLFELLGTGGPAANAPMAAEVLLAIHAMLRQLPDPSLLGAAAARALATWAGMAPGLASRAALDCIGLLRGTPLFAAEYAQAATADPGGVGLASRLAAALADEGAEWKLPSGPLDGSAYAEQREHHARDVWLPVLIDHRSEEGKAKRKVSYDWA